MDKDMKRFKLALECFRISLENNSLNTLERSWEDIAYLKNKVQN